MSSVKLFFNFMNAAFGEFTKDFNVYLSSFIAFFLLDLASSIPWEAMGYENNSFYEILVSILSALVSLVVIANVILIQKARINQTNKEDLLYAAPTYLIYTLYSSLIMLAGFLCLVIPGIIALVLLSLVPMASIIVENDNVNYFKLSYKLARKDVALVISFLAMTFLIELPQIAFSFIPNLALRMGLSVVYGLIDAALIVILTIASVHIFYHLKRRYNGFV